VVAAALVVALLCIGGGATLWLRQAKWLPAARREHIRTVGAFGGLILLALFLSMLGAWLGGLLTLVLVVLLLVASLDSFVTSP
jgi:hypothetical protein